MPSTAAADQTLTPPAIPPLQTVPQELLIQYQPHATLCSNECRALRKHGWDSTRPSRQREKSNTTQLTTSAATGYSNELRVTQDLMHRGFHVATFNYAAPIDLIAYKNGHTITIEVKTDATRHQQTTPPPPRENPRKSHSHSRRHRSQILGQPHRQRLRSIPPRQQLLSLVEAINPGLIGIFPVVSVVRVFAVLVFVALETAVEAVAEVTGFASLPSKAWPQEWSRCFARSSPARGHSSRSALAEFSAGAPRRSWFRTSSTLSSSTRRPSSAR